MASRRIVGFAVGQHHDAALATTALRMAVTVQGGMPAVAGVVFHSDQGNEHRGCLPSRLRPAWGHPVHGPGRVRARQRGHRELALHRGVRAPHARALHHQGPGPQPDRGMDRGVQPRPPALLDRDDLPRRVRTSSQPRRPPLLKPRLGRSPRHDHRPASRSVEHGRVLAIQGRRNRAVTATVLGVRFAVGTPSDRPVYLDEGLAPPACGVRCFKPWPGR